MSQFTGIVGYGTEALPSVSYDGEKGEYFDHG